MKNERPLFKKQEKSAIICTKIQSLFFLPSSLPQLVMLFFNLLFNVILRKIRISIIRMNFTICLYIVQCHL